MPSSEAGVSGGLGAALPRGPGALVSPGARDGPGVLAGVPVLVAAGLLLLCVAVPALVFSASPGRVLLGIALAVIGYQGAGYLILDRVAPQLPFRVRLALSTAAGFASLAPVQFLSAGIHRAAPATVGLAALALGVFGLRRAIAAARAASTGERRVSGSALLVMAALTLALCIPAAREMSIRRGGNLTVQYVDMPYHGAVVQALRSFPPRHPLSPSVNFYYHHFLYASAARLVDHVGLSIPDALHRVVRPLGLLGALLAMAGFATLFGAGSTRASRSAGWLGPLIVVGLPSLGLFWRGLHSVSHFVRNVPPLGLSLPEYGWDVGGELLMSPGSLGMGLLVPLMPCLLHARERGFRAADGVVVGLLAGTIVGFNAVLFLVVACALLFCVAAALAERRGWGPPLAAAAVTIVWGAALLGHFTAGSNRPSVGNVAPLTNGTRLLLDSLPMLHVKLALAAAGVTAFRKNPFALRFILGMLLAVVALAFTAPLGFSALKYLRETGSLIVSLLAAVGAMRLVPAVSRGRRAIGALGLGILAGGALLSTQFLWRPGQEGRDFPRLEVPPGVIASLRDMSKRLPPEAVPAGTAALIAPQWAATDSLRAFYWFAYPSLSERLWMAEARDSTGFGYLGDVRIVRSAATVAALFADPSSAVAESLAVSSGITHLVFAPGQQLGWTRCPPWLRPYPVAGTLRVFEVLKRREVRLDFPAGHPVQPFIHGRRRVGEALIVAADREDLDHNVALVRARLKLTAT